MKNFVYLKHEYSNLYVKLKKLKRKKCNRITFKYVWWANAWNGLWQWNEKTAKTTLKNLTKKLGNNQSKILAY